MARSTNHSARIFSRNSIAIALAVSMLGGTAAHALKFAERAHDMIADPRIPNWVPANIETQPEEELNIVGADVMDEMTLGWIRMMRRAYPRLSVTLEARASGSGGPALVDGTAHLAPVGRELLPAEEKSFIAKFGYAPTAIRVATGSVGSLGKTAASIIMVDTDNPIDCLSMQQLDQIYSASHNRGGKPITRWADLGMKGKLAKLPINLYGLRHPNGIESYFQMEVLKGGAYRNDITFVKGKGFTHAFNVAADDMKQNPGGLTYAMLANLQPNTKAVALSQETGGECVYPTTETIYDHSYPLSRYVYIYINKKPGVPVEPKIKEFLRAVLSHDGQQKVAEDGVYLPMMPEVVAEELAKVERL